MDSSFSAPHYVFSSPSLASMTPVAPLISPSHENTIWYSDASATLPSMQSYFPQEQGFPGVPFLTESVASAAHPSRSSVTPSSSSRPGHGRTYSPISELPSSRGHPHFLQYEVPISAASSGKKRRRKDDELPTIETPQDPSTRPTKRKRTNAKGNTTAAVGPKTRKTATIRPPSASESVPSSVSVQPPYIAVSGPSRTTRISGKRTTTTAPTFNPSQRVNSRRKSPQYIDLTGPEYESTHTYIPNTNTYVARLRECLRYIQQHRVPPPRGWKGPKPFSLIDPFSPGLIDYSQESLSREDQELERILDYASTLISEEDFLIWESVCARWTAWAYPSVVNIR